MKFKVFTKNNYFYIVNIADLTEYEAHKKNVLIRRQNENEDVFYFSNVNGYPNDISGALHINDILDQDTNDYGSSDRFIDWYTAETGGTGAER